MTTIKVGYQGISGSYSEEAAIQMLQHRGIHTFTLVPLISSQGVIDGLKHQLVDYGVIAIKNSIGGIVQESAKALENEKLVFLDSITLPIRHVAFKKNQEIKNDEIQWVISHEQALKQCQANIKKIFPNANMKAIEDTAIGAKYLEENKYDSFTVVICKREAGLQYNLYLAKESMQDSADNRTKFHLFKL